MRQSLLEKRTLTARAQHALDRRSEDGGMRSGIVEAPQVTCPREQRGVSPQMRAHARRQLCEVAIMTQHIAQAQRTCDALG